MKLHAKSAVQTFEVEVMKMKKFLFVAGWERKKRTLKRLKKAEWKVAEEIASSLSSPRHCLCKRFRRRCRRSKEWRRRKIFNIKSFGWENNRFDRG